MYLRCQYCITMGTRNEFIEKISSYSDVLRTQFGVSSLQLFGSVARNDQTPNSDVDVCEVMKL